LVPSQYLVSGTLGEGCIKSISWLIFSEAKEKLEAPTRNVVKNTARVIRVVMFINIDSRDSKLEGKSKRSIRIATLSIGCFGFSLLLADMS
jgi:hypothetical protein